MTSSADAPVRPGFLASLGRRGWGALAGMAGAVAVLHVLGWGVLVGAVAPAHLSLPDGRGAGTALGVTAYLLGMRHAFDADHIAAIDNSARKLAAEGERSLTTGFWFSLGHSSVVLGLCLLLAAGVRALAGQVEDSHSTLQRLAGTAGTAVSGTFLLLLGLVNLASLAAVARVWRQMRRGRLDEAELERHLQERGLMNRVLAPVVRAVRRPRHLYPVGFLFGLGFDTATEVSLLVLAGAGAAVALPWYAVLVLPVLFAAGMVLPDSIDGVLVDLAYGWAFARPVRRVFYNLVITGLSVAVALVVGAIEVDSLLADQLGVTSGPLRAVADLDLGQVGYLVVGLFVLTRVVALTWWRVGRVEERWSASLGAAAPPAPGQCG